MFELVPHMSCVANEQEFEAAVAKYPEVYVINGIGDILRHIRLKGENRFVRVKVPSIPGVKREELSPAVEEAISFLPNGKIPKIFLQEIVQFFKEVMTVKKAEQEAMAHVLWNDKDKNNEHRGYRIAIPNQTVGKASVHYEHDHIEKGDIVVLDIHSHNSMGAFFSGTDDNDDKKGIFFSGVVGHLDQKSPAFVWRLNINEIKKDADAYDIFDIEKPNIKIPSDWLDKVKTQGYGSWQPGQHYQGGNHYMGKFSPPEVRRAERNDGGRSGNANSNYAGGDVYNSEYGGGVRELYDDMDTEMFSRGYPHLNEALNESNTVAPEKKEEKKPNLILVASPGQYSPTEKKKMAADGVIVEEAEDIALGQGEKDAIAINHGPKIADSYEQLALYLADLEGEDDLLINVMSKIFGMLSSEGQGRLASKGF